MGLIGTAWSLLPSLVAILLALVTKDALLSLLAGVVVGGVLLGMPSPLAMLQAIVGDGSGNGLGLIGTIADASNAGLLLFPVLIGIMLALMERSGAAGSFGTWVTERVRTRQSSQLACSLLGCLLFVDDYFSCLVCGAVMRPVTQRTRVSRAKLAFLIDATAAPVCMIAPLSSWAAAVSATATDLGGVSGLELFVRAIPYNFYSLLTLVFVFALALTGRDFGPMLSSERAAAGNTEAPAAKCDTNSVKHAGPLDFVLSIVLLVACCVSLMLWTGGFWNEGPAQGSLALALGDTNTSFSLPAGTLLALALSAMFLIARRSLHVTDLGPCIVEGARSMVPGVLTLVLALSLKAMTAALDAQGFVFGLMSAAPNTLEALLPALLFVVATGLAFATGTSWGTFAILIPIAIAVLGGASEATVAGIAACLAGAVCGDHASPPSDTTVMAATSADVGLTEHVQTQLPYVLLIAGVSLLCYVACGLGAPWLACMVAGGAALVAALLALGRTVG